MNDTQALLEFIYKNAEMGKKTLSPISDMNSNEEFDNVISRLIGQYAEICSEADRQLTALGWDKASGRNGMEKLMTEASLRMSTMKDRSVRILEIINNATFIIISFNVIFGIKF